jgi:type IV secretory pathway VirB4 component
VEREDRFSHVYIIGKTGTGKSTLIERMVLQDLERRNGLALIDPHGD